MLGAALATLAAAAGQTENFDYSTSNIGLHRNDSFAGQVCAGATTDTSAFDLLRGRHLLIDTLQWAPFDVIDPTHPDGWSGFDIDLLQSLASILGFTYDIQDMGYPEGNETYTDLLFRRASNADLIMTYWTHTVERMATFSPLFGHVDYSGVLTSHPRAPGESTFHDRFKTFFRPFEPSLWAALLVLVMLAGFNDWTLERKAGGKLADSIYEAWAGALWGGFEYPKSRSSAIYQITLSFIMLIVVSAYTANLAAFLTIPISLPFSPSDAPRRSRSAPFPRWKTTICRRAQTGTTPTTRYTQGFTPAWDSSTTARRPMAPRCSSTARVPR